MDLSDIEANSEDQDRGKWFDLLDPVTGEKIGMRWLIAGPDGAVQARARLRLADELADMADDEGRVSAENRAGARLNCLARCVLGWEVSDGGAPVPFNHKNVLRALRAAAWVQAQVDAFAADRRAFFAQSITGVIQ